MRSLLAAFGTFLLAGCTAAGVVDELNSSPRHHEWIGIEGPNREIDTFVVYPERSDPAPVVLVIHENRGLTNWVREVADRLAKEGFIAVAPDFLSGMGPGGGNTAAFPDRNSARDALYTLTDEGTMEDLEAVAGWTSGLAAATEELFVAGFCWGGQRAFQFATVSDRADEVYVFYGTPPETTGLKGIDAPVYGFYGENDARVTSTVDETVTAMAAAGKIYRPVIYPGAGHGFMRSGEETGAEPANREAMRRGWERWLVLMRSD